MAERKARIKRDTKETRIAVEVNLDGKGLSQLHIGIPFLEHMIEQVARHGMIDLAITAEGDLHIDAHHMVEDVGITLGQAINQAMNVWFAAQALTGAVITLLRLRLQHVDLQTGA